MRLVYAITDSGDQLGPDRSELRLAELLTIGWTAAAAVEWFYRGLTGAQQEVVAGIWDFADELASRWQGVFPPKDDFARFLGGAPGKPTSFALGALSVAGPFPLWNVEVRPVRPSVPACVPEAQRRSLLPWSLCFGRHDMSDEGRNLEFLVQFASRWLTIHVQPRVLPPSDITNWASLPWHLKQPGAHPATRRRFQAVDAQAEPTAQFDPRWDPRLLVESVMAQLIDWHYRVAKVAPEREYNLPKPAGDALAWWVNWVQDAARDHEGIGLPEALKVAERSVRPAHPAGHRKYWHQSLRPRSHTTIEQACGQLRIARSTAYTRLKKAGRRADEFSSTQDLANFLRQQAPRRHLPLDRRELIEGLKEAGMTAEAARKFEYRLRQRPSNEQRERLAKKLQALRTTAGKP